MHPRFGNNKSWKSMILARWLMKLSILILCYTPSLIEGRRLTNHRSVLNRTRANHQDICLTPECVHTASAILRNMDPNVDPCEDFYRYACGGFINQTFRPDSISGVHTSTLMNAKLHQRIKAMMQEKVEPDEPRHVRLVKDFYKICMNKIAIEVAGLEPLHAQLEKLGGWPVLLGDAWAEDEFDWQSTIYKFREIGYSHNVLINFDIIADWGNGTRRVIMLDEGTTRLPYKYLLDSLNNKVVQAYHNYMVEIAVLLGANRQSALYELEQSLIFEMRLADISSASKQQLNQKQLYSPMTIKLLSRMYPSIRWKEYVSRLLPSSINIEDDGVVVVFLSSYFSKLEKLLLATPKRTQANYLMWIAVTDSIAYLNDAIRYKKQMFSASFTGNTGTMQRSNECTETIFQFLPIIISAMYVKKYFSEEAKKNAADIIMDIREQFNIILKTIDWMDEETRKKALEKAAAMVSHVAYPEELLDDKKLEKIYEKLYLSDHDYLATVLKLKSLSTEWRWEKLREPINKTDWMSHGVAAIVNAYYSTQENSIQFPAGILQGIFFNNDRPKYMNYGAIGFIIGHEITHGFDVDGKQFDKNGNLDNWWDPSTDKNYDQRVQCVIEQYGNYSVPEVNLTLNGYNTQDENVADNGGIKIAYLAYKSWVERNKPEQKLPGIDRNPKQMFWLSAANVWCSKNSPEALREDVLSEPHSPDEFRVLGSFSNMPEFANDFNCREGSRMNPKKKCSIW